MEGRLWRSASRNGLADFPAAQPRDSLGLLNLGMESGFVVRSCAYSDNRPPGYSYYFIKKEC